MNDYIKITDKNDVICPFFQWDNYIRACHSLFPKWFNSRLFYTYDDDNNRSANGWGYDAFKTQSREGLSLRQDFINFIKNPGTALCENAVSEELQYNKWIVNIDLDFFWDFDGIKIYDNQYIDDFARIINASMNNIQVLTIALSPECIGGNNIEEKWRNVKEVLGVMKREIKGLSDCSF